jgi:prevent-host-death family protein
VNLGGLRRRPALGGGRLQRPFSLDLDHRLVHYWMINRTRGVTAMRVSVSEAKGQLTELVRRAEAGDEVVLTRHGQAAVRLVPVRSTPEPAARRDLLERLRRQASAKARPGPSAARSQDDLYGDDGLPR